MKLDNSLRTVQISSALIAQFIEEKLGQFGFKETDEVVKIELLGVPKIVTIKIKSRKEKEVQIIKH